MHGTEIPQNLKFDHLDLDNLTEEQKNEIERSCFNTIVAEKWKNKSLKVPEAAPSFADYNQDLWDVFVDYLGPIAGKRVLELGCGSGEIATWFALNGAVASASDVSDESIVYANKRNAENGTAVEFFVGTGEHIPYDDATFDAVTINVALHHMDVPRALREIKRVLKPGGALVCVEPFIFSDGLQSLRHSALAQKLFPERRETPTERMLDRRDEQEIRVVFGNANVQMQPVRSFSSAVMKVPFFNQATSALARLQGREIETARKSLVGGIQQIDGFLIRYIPGFRALSRYVIIKAVK